MSMRFAIVVLSALTVPCTVAVSLADDQEVESQSECKCTDCKCADGDNEGCQCTDCKCGESQCTEGKCTEGACAEGKCAEGKCKSGTCNESKCCKEKCASGKCPDGECKQCKCEGCDNASCDKDNCECDASAKTACKCSGEGCNSCDQGSSVSITLTSGASGNGECASGKCSKGSCNSASLACNGKECCSEGKCSEGKCSDGSCCDQGKCCKDGTYCQSGDFAFGIANCSEESALRFSRYGLFDAESSSLASNEVWKRLASELNGECRACEATEATEASANEPNGSVFLVLDSAAGGDVALREKCGAGTTVGSLLRGSILPHPVNFAAAEIEVRRARTIANDDKTVEVQERILPVLWDQTTGQPTKCTNHTLQPNDRVCVRMKAKSEERPMAIAAAYSQAAPMVHRAIPLPRAKMASKTPTQVQYNIQVVEDCEGCMAEFEALERGAPMMFAESKTLLPAMRALEKHELIRQLSSPTLICTAGQTAQMEVGSEAPEKWEGVRLEVASEQVENGLKVELAMHSTQNDRNVKVATALVVEPGQTIVLNANAMPMAKEKSKAEKRAVYVVVTPEVVE